MSSLKPFFCYYGGKYRAVPKYPRPKYRTIIEPFAGAAGYATRYPYALVNLYDRDEIIAGLWSYLIRVSEEEIRALPIHVSHVDELAVVQEAKWLIGFWISKGNPSPKKTPTTWFKRGDRPHSFWGETIRERIASQLYLIRHWKITHGSFTDAPAVCATWFVDPPYAAPCGRLYRYDDVDFNQLAMWCRCRRGQVIVCEQEGADWLPFQYLGTFRSLDGKHGKKKTTEAMWYQDTSIASVQSA
jgi:hypothetical protein